MTSELLTLAAICSATLLGQVTVDQLAKPPANAQNFTILSTAGTNGKASTWVAGDGVNMTRQSVLLRGQVWEIDQAVKLGADGMPVSVVVRGVSPTGDAAETFGITRNWPSL